MRGSKRNDRRRGTWELRIDAGYDRLTGTRRQRGLIYSHWIPESDERAADVVSTRIWGDLSENSVLPSGGPAPGSARGPRPT